MSLFKINGVLSTRLILLRLRVNELDLAEEYLFILGQLIDLLLQVLNLIILLLRR